MGLYWYTAYWVPLSALSTSVLTFLFVLNKALFKRSMLFHFCSSSFFFFFFWTQWWTLLMSLDCKKVFLLSQIWAVFSVIWLVVFQQFLNTETSNAQPAASVAAVSIQKCINCATLLAGLILQDHMILLYAEVLVNFGYWLALLKICCEVFNPYIIVGITHRQ